MRERPIIMGADSVRAILAGLKTQTRRVVTCLDSRGARLRVRALLRDGTTREVSVSRERVRLAEPGDNASRWKGL